MRLLVALRSGTVQRNPLLFMRSAALCAGLRQSGRNALSLYPALIPQRASAPRKRDRATIGRPWRDCAFSFSAKMSMPSVCRFAAEGRSFTQRPKQPSTPGASPGVFFFSCSGDAIRRPARASARRGRTKKHSAISTQQSAKPREKSHVSGALVCQDVLFRD
jgi:hypothetical protein